MADSTVKFIGLQSSCVIMLTIFPTEQRVALLFMQSYRFTPHWAMALLAFMVMALFLRLGVWQLERAAEKKQMLASVAKEQNQSPQPWDAGQKLPHQYQNISLTGRFLPHVFLLDNQHYQHQFGYDVLSALVLHNGQVVLVDRGWIAAGSSRKTHLPIKTPKKRLRVMGQTYYPSKQTWMLGPVLEVQRPEAVIIEQVDIHRISQFLHKSVYPFIIRLGKEADDGYVREWPVVSMPPERHYGYALQWFAMALIILILFVALNLKKKI
jgi:surfeit locus 1 family protein